MIEFKACRKCHHTKGPVPEGYYMEERLNPRTGIKVPIMIECEHHRIWRIKKSAEKKFIDNGFNKDFYDYDIANYKGNESMVQMVHKKLLWPIGLDLNFYKKAFRVAMLL